MKNVITVTQLNKYIKDIIDAEDILGSIYIVGEISNFVHYYRSGHMYFTLKDEKSQLKAVMFSSYAQRIKFKAENGMRVICRGRISVYEKDGVYQLYVEDMQPDGIGSLNLAYEQLKEKLANEGLFSDIHKKPIPQFPRKIGVATSNTGAAIEDIKNITARRYPLAELVIAPTIVQGDLAGPDIIRSIEMLERIDDIDLIIVGRGGGSIEDLWAFNLESVARAVFNCKKPVISAVGHETDYTICDFVADLRASTPSAAAELSVPDSAALINYLDGVTLTLNNTLRSKLDNAVQQLDYIENNSILAAPAVYYKTFVDKLDALQTDLAKSLENRLEQGKYTIGTLAAELDALSPLAVISRGYSMASDKDGALIKSVKQVSTGDNIIVRFNDGNAVCTVNEVEYE